MINVFVEGHSYSIRSITFDCDNPEKAIIRVSGELRDLYDVPPAHHQFVGEEIEINLFGIFVTNELSAVVGRFLKVIKKRIIEHYGDRHYERSAVKDYVRKNESDSSEHK